ncbi:uncharacterized protein LOC115769654 [Drosophila novamexicana]|uniref:Uncharacterized protein, isoform A n=1 Tax=Drosophila virilis TaxID=7244 RepID=B4LBY9_DROVI|nr:uncharacterized protein LOC6624294 isoform X1 [Drosophila virilis]XP_030570426.1 uncharacterized protein LOC115769654 [Drosophila novamexicana]EDW69789.1 uncharacterized protein Dvir_GJ13450, isoform A [Drosophila virilis]
MVYSVKNSETGEFEYFYTDSARVKQPKYDEETGEPVHDQMKVRYRKHGNFHVPKQYLRGTICDEVDTMLANKHHGDWDITAKHVIGNGATKNVDKLKKITPGYEREDYIKMDGVSSNIILGYERNSFLLFLIPTLFCWNFFLWALMSILEISLHMLSHYKNSLTMQKNLYFRSPLHVLSSQFCAICRNESGSKYNRTFDILNEQMRLAHRSDALKNMAKAMG